LIKIETRENVRYLWLNFPPVNALGLPMRSRLQDALIAAFEDASVQIIALGSQLPLFCGGADIHEFRSGELWDQPHLPALCDLVDSSPKPIVAAINGTAMGGALEISLACDYRIAKAGVLLGLPEVKLGLLPGAGGTQRLPRIAGLAAAAAMILSGDPVTAEHAFETGLLDRVTPREQDFDVAVQRYCVELASANAPTRSGSDRQVDMSSVNHTFFADTRMSLTKNPRGQIAPARCLTSIEAACQLPLAQGLKQEREAFVELLDTAQARAMIHLFFAQRDALKVAGVSGDTDFHEVSSVAVVGAGTMGTGISIALLDADLPVKLLDQTTLLAEQGRETIKAHYRRAESRGRISQRDVEQRVALLSVGEHIETIAQCDLVIEAVFESITVKQALFRQLDKICKPGAILASNTSTLDLDAIAEVTNRAADVIGLHFFSPANLMRLLEIVRGEQTSAATILSAQRFAQRIRKVPVVVGVCFGFVGNRMLEPYFREASRLLLEGASPAQIDRVLTEFGMAMGVLSMGDLAGIDVGFRIRESRRAELAHDPGYQAVQEDALYSLGRYGQKTQRGVYRYKGRERIDDPEVVMLAQGLAEKLGIERRVIDDQEILERCLYPLINEGCLLLEQGIAERAGDCDLIWVNGYGFPAARGGPMHYASEIGYATVLEGMHKYQRALGEYGRTWFIPAESLIAAAH